MPRKERATALAHAPRRWYAGAALYKERATCVDAEISIFDAFCSKNEWASATVAKA